MSKDDLNKRFLRSDEVLDNDQWKLLDSFDCNPFKGRTQLRRSKSPEKTNKFEQAESLLNLSSNETELLTPTSEVQNTFSLDSREIPLEIITDICEPNSKTAQTNKTTSSAKTVSELNSPYNENDEAFLSPKANNYSPTLELDSNSTKSENSKSLQKTIDSSHIDRVKFSCNCVLRLDDQVVEESNFSIPVKILK